MANGRMTGLARALELVEFQRSQVLSRQAAGDPLEYRRYLYAIDALRRCGNMIRKELGQPEVEFNQAAIADPFAVHQVSGTEHAVVHPADARSQRAPDAPPAPTPTPTPTPLPTPAPAPLPPAPVVPSHLGQVQASGRLRLVG